MHCVTRHLQRLVRIAGLAGICGTVLAAGPAPLDRIVVSPDREHFTRAHSGSLFRLWGFNYDRDSSGRLLEDYWQTEWPAVEKDFGAMKALGANVVRIHLQLGRFMKSASQTNDSSIMQLTRLVQLAERTGLYLDITGLGCYHRADVPLWYNKMGESERWDTQARFWEAVASACAESPAVFCYDLMNEPIVGGDVKDRDWTPDEFGGSCFVQRLTLDPAGRTDKEIAKAWVDKLSDAIRKHDKTRLVTVGAIPWAMVWPAAKPLFYSPEVGRNLDFVSVHFYPEEGHVDKALTALAVYKIGKPLVIEEMFPLKCSMAELGQFVDGSRAIAAGWIGFYWGKGIEQYQQEPNDTNSVRTMEWLKYFTGKAPEMSGGKNSP